MPNPLHSLWLEPPAPDPPARVWRDWLLLGVLIPIALLEATLRTDVVWPAISLAVALLAIVVLLWRRRHPLAMVVIAFGTTAAIQLVAFSMDVRWEGFGTGACLLLLPYALARWASGRDVMMGLVVIMLSFAIGMFTAKYPVTDIIGGGIVVLFPVAIGAAVRYQDTAHRRAVGNAKLSEREQLARELHDTVAHHVSAIAIQAQAGRTLADMQPEAAAEALAVIEEAASRTLAEMRTMVGALRDGGEAELAPQPGVSEIARLADSTHDGPRIAVQVTGNVDDLTPTVDAALYRLAQESITNAVRHARNATRVDVRISAEAESVRLTVRDDGEAPAHATPGYGLTGMMERATLLGGMFEAGPDEERGWLVTAVLPRKMTS